MTKSAAYILSAYSFISTQKIERLLDVGYEPNDGNPIPSFDENVLIKLCSDVQNIFQKENNILLLEGDLIIVGDIHGSLHDLLRILKYIQEKDSKVLFLGDYVDRGSFSLECITILFALKVMKPDNFFLIRGNHEFDSLCSQYGFKEEILSYHNPRKCKNPTIIRNENAPISETLILNFKADKMNKNDEKENQTNNSDQYYCNHGDMNCYKYTENLYGAFIQAFSYLPIGAIINQTNFCIHGGLSPHLENINQLQYGIIRPINNFEDNTILSDVLWSDPTSDFTSLFGDNPRGRGCLFSMNAVFNFLNTNFLKRIIRAHQCIKHGMHTQFNEKLITVFSASSYNSMQNSSGILELFKKDDRIHFTSFPPIKRLEKSDASYYKVQAFDEEAENKSHICFSFLHPKLISHQAVRMVTTTTKNKKIKQHQSLRFAKPLYLSPTKNMSQLIQKPIILHSVSMNNFNSNEQMDSNTEKGMTRSMYSFNDISKF